MELGGLSLGLLSLGISMFCLSREMKARRTGTWPSMASMGACVLSLYDQLLFRCHLAAEHVSSWEDTAGGAALVSGLLLFAALVLNSLVLGMEQELRRGDAEKKGTR